MVPPKVCKAFKFLDQTLSSNHNTQLESHTNADAGADKQQTTLEVNTTYLQPNSTLALVNLPLNSRQPSPTATMCRAHLFKYTICEHFSPNVLWTRCACGLMADDCPRKRKSYIVVGDLCWRCKATWGVTTIKPRRATTAATRLTDACTVERFWRVGREGYSSDFEVEGDNWAERALAAVEAGTVNAPSPMAKSTVRRQRSKVAVEVEKSRTAAPDMGKTIRRNKSMVAVEAERSKAARPEMVKTIRRMKSEANLGGDRANRLSLPETQTVRRMKSTAAVEMSGSCEKPR